jgi:hypothetical protein
MRSCADKYVLVKAFGHTLRRLFQYSTHKSFPIFTTV